MLDIGPQNSLRLRTRFIRLSLALALITIQVTVRFCSVPPQILRRALKGPGAYYLSSPSTNLTRELVARRLFKVPPCREGTIHLQTSMSSAKFEPRSFGTAVSVANHYTGWATQYRGEALRSSLESNSESRQDRPPNRDICSCTSAPYGHVYWDGHSRHWPLWAVAPLSMSLSFKDPELWRTVNNKRAYPSNEIRICVLMPPKNTELMDGTHNFEPPSNDEDDT
ncbi:hypothetical protein TNCV_914721 [Trichonephila clavipes]|uniref:Uncharacterized protein n=1 Tax=Trichonephila clavipes TaxID=2585209 RepID=A0A8X6RPP4_TRICX|nr:hypothetical protein TNCV_914721 [Trichonephila clavipes]